MLGETEDYWQKIAQKLHKKGWITQNGKAFEMHALLAEITRHKNQHRLFADCEKMIDFLINELHPDNTHKENYKYATLYSLYAESVVNVFTEPHTNFSILLERIGTFYQTTGNLSKALDFYKKANAVDEKLLAQNPENPDFKNGLAISYYKLYEIYAQMGKKSESKKYLVQAVGIFEELKNDYPAYAQFTQFWNIAKNQLSGL